MYTNGVPLRSLDDEEEIDQTQNRESMTITGREKN